MDSQPGGGSPQDKVVVLFDLPTKEPRQCSSLHVWKVRALLNFKNIPYRTNWIDYPDVAPTFKGFDIPKNDDTAYTEYWCPVVRFPDGCYAMESYNIAEKLEFLWPQPETFVTSTTTKRTQDIIDSVLVKIAPANLSRLADRLSPISREWYHRSRGKLFGGLENCYQIAELEPFSGDIPWQQASAGIKDLERLLSENDEGPFVLGAIPSYADFIVAGFWEGLKLLDKEGDVFGRMMNQSPTFVCHESACKPWFVRRSY